MTSTGGTSDDDGTIGNNVPSCGSSCGSDILASTCGHGANPTKNCLAHPISLKYSDATFSATLNALLRANLLHILPRATSPTWRSGESVGLGGGHRR